jgi:TatA/E family protein of Tat protein translocase
MFGTLGFSELIIILAIVLIIFGAGKLPQIGEGLGKALKGFKKEVHDVPTPIEPEPAAGSSQATEAQSSETSHEAKAQATPGGSAPYQPGPELTPGTTAALRAAAGPQSPQPRPQPSGHGQPSDQSHQPPTVEERQTRPAPIARAAYPPVPPNAQAKPVPKRPSAIVNKDAVARVQAQQAALKAQKGQKDDGGISPQDMQGFGETLGDTLRSFRQAAADVRNVIDPEMRTIRAELDTAHKEIEQSIEAARQMPAVDEEPKSS